MKKIINCLLVLLALCSLTACTVVEQKTKEEKTKTVEPTVTEPEVTEMPPVLEGDYELPDISGKSLVDAIVATGGKINLVPVYVKTNQYLPDVVIGYGSQLKAGDKIAEGSNIGIEIAARPDNAVSYDKRIDYVSEICKITGPKSHNDEVLKEAGVQGTDLGIPVKVGDKMILLFGDTFSVASPTGPGWKSNFITTVDDTVYWYNLTVTPLVNDFNGAVLPFYEGKHQGGNETDNTVEVTKIPTGGITIGDTVYVFYMSIRFWGVAGSWNVNYNGVVKSNVNDLHNWTEVPELTWTEAEAPNFGQIYPFEDPNSDYIYVYGIPGGRSGGCVVGRTTKENFTNKAEYEYLVAEEKWVKGAKGLEALLKNPYYAVGPAVSEMSVAYNEYLGKYIMPFYRNGKIIIAQSEKPYGTFTDTITVLTQQDYNGIYGGFIHPEFITDGGKSIYMTISCWETYNVYWVKVVLK